MFKEHKEITVEVYIDDMIIISKRVKDHARDITEAFDVLDKVEMKLNSNKCTFIVKVGKFLNFMFFE